MASYVHYLVICVVNASLWTIQLLEAFPNSCINLPSPPLHGKLTISGQFLMRIKCLNPDTDLPVNAPGDGGVLMCDPNEEVLTDLPEVYSPVCLDYKKPNQVYILVRLTYTSNSCNATHIKGIKNALTQLQSSNLRFLQAACGVSLACSYTAPDVDCKHNYNFLQKSGSEQLDVTFKIYAPYEQALPTSQYLTILKEIRKNSFAADQGIPGAGQLWDIYGAQFVHADIAAWAASCINHNNTLGSNLAIHGIASCRGCPQGTIYIPGRTCEPCPFNHYTDGPFAYLCNTCPPESLWGTNKERWIKLCYDRY